MDILTERTSAGTACDTMTQAIRNDTAANSAYIQSITGSLAEYMATGLTPAEVAELAQAKANGRLIVLPCKIGDTIYRLSGTVKNGLETLKPTCIVQIEGGFNLTMLRPKTGKLADFYYTTYTEARAALDRIEVLN